MAGGSAINVQIKSGTNQIHGSLFEFHANSAIKAKPFFLPAGQGMPKYIDNQFGGSVGGPIIKNKLFYFGSWEDSLQPSDGRLLCHRADRGHALRQHVGLLHSDLRPADAATRTAAAARPSSGILFRQTASTRSAPKWHGRISAADYSRTC